MLILIGLVFVLLIMEAWGTRRSVDSISVRILVNGTRGKSSTAGYIAAALRTSGKQVMAKVTGEIPTLILHDGSKETIRRWGPARIQEQFRLIRRAARSGTDALVMECMSIDPVLQETEGRFFKPHIYVLTNIRDDHREKMGVSEGDRVTAMCQAIPQGCVLITGDTQNLEAIRNEAEKKKCSLVVVESPGEKKQESMNTGQLPLGVFTENIELAEETAVQAGMDREMARAAILKFIASKAEKEGALQPGEGRIQFLNAFPVNDPESATVYLDRWMAKYGIRDRLVLIFNTRADRPLRTDMFSQWIRDRKDQLAGVYITGDHRARAHASLRDLKPGLDVCMVPSGRVQDLPSRLVHEYGIPLKVAGIGNIRGEGYRVITTFET